MRDRVYIIGSGMVKIGKNEGTYESMCAEAIQEAMEDAGLNYEGDKDAIEGIWYANCGQGICTGQHCIRGQVVLRRLNFEKMPIVNVENACASATTALNQAVIYILAGGANLALAVGIEKRMTFDPEKLSGFPELQAMLPYIASTAFWSGCERDRKEQYVEKWRKQKSEMTGIPYDQTDVGVNRTPFMDHLAVKTLKGMKKYGCSQEHLARVSAKTHRHGAMNPKAQYQKNLTWQEVLNDKLITYPLTRAMCAPRGAGCAAAIVCSEKYLHEHPKIKAPVLIRASVLVSGSNHEGDGQDITNRTAQLSFRQSGLRPKDIDILELHDAVSFLEIHQTAQAGFCKTEHAAEYCSSGATSLGGELPTNVSGGLISRGHPLGCTGLAQVYEIMTQLRGRAGKRQVKGARIGMHINGGGIIGAEEASMGAHILERV